MFLLKGSWFVLPWITASHASRLCYQWGLDSLVCPDICCGTSRSAYCCQSGSTSSATWYSWLAALWLITLMISIRCCCYLRSRQQRRNNNNSSLGLAVISTGSLSPSPAHNRIHADHPPPYNPEMTQPPPSYAEVMAKTTDPPTEESTSQPASSTCHPQADSVYPGL